VRLALPALALFIVLGVVVHGDGGLGIDEATFDAIDPLRSAAGLDIVRVLTDLGSFPVAAAVILVAAIYLWRAHGPTGAVMLAGGLIVLLVLVNVSKELVGRPRPAGRFYDPSGLSFPSGHSAYATAWVAAAVLTGRRGLIAAATFIVIAVGASRLYLHVHYLTDVVAGMALGAAVFAALRPRI
jgi:membrane-associated phospholipid phosphatase